MPRFPEGCVISTGASMSGVRSGTRDGDRGGATARVRDGAPSWRRFRGRCGGGRRTGLGFRRAAQTSPWGLIVLLLLGFAAGILSCDADGRLDRQAARTGRRSGIPPVRLTRVKWLPIRSISSRSHKLIPIEVGGVDFSFTNSAAVHGGDGRRRFGVPDPRHARARPGAGPLAVGRRGDLRVRGQDAARFDRQRRDAVLPAASSRSSSSSCSPT